MVSEVGFESLLVGFDFLAEDGEDPGDTIDFDELELRFLFGDQFVKFHQNNFEGGFVFLDFFHLFLQELFFLFAFVFVFVFFLHVGVGRGQCEFFIIFGDLSFGHEDKSVFVFLIKLFNHFLLACADFQIVDAFLEHFVDWDR